MEAALEAGEVGDFLDPIADDFIAENGGLDRRSLALLVRRERMARDRIAITRTDPSVELHGETRATARFNALATGGSGLLPDEGQLWSIETGWRLDDGEWTDDQRRLAPRVRRRWLTPGGVGSASIRRTRHSCPRFSGSENVTDQTPWHDLVSFPRVVRRLVRTFVRVRNADPASRLAVRCAAVDRPC
jgi:hypothetical protein